MITHITTHKADAIARLLEQYKGKSRIEALISSLVGGYQSVEDAFNDLGVNRFVAVATGETLTNIGSIVGAERSDLDDETLRLLILARIQVNISNGAPETLIMIFKLITKANEVIFREYPHGDIQMFTNGTLALDKVEFVYGLLTLARLAGVSLSAIGTYSSTAPLRFMGLRPGAGFGTGKLGNLLKQQGDQ